jgi:DNA-binding GntR family transcriptional regulator
MSAITPLEPPQNLTQLAYQKIKGYILSEDLDEETRLTEDALSRQLGISKSPVREALNSLHTEGLIRIEARRGAYLRRFSLKEVQNLYELREVLELYAVGAVQLSSKLLAELRDSVQRTRRMLKANDLQGHIEEDTRFHALIASATDNAELCRVLSNIQNQLWLCRRKTYRLSASTAPDAHGAILEALEQGDLRKAQDAMRKHVVLVRERRLNFIQTERDSG